MNKNSQFQTPILFLIFNRPDTTEQVFEQIKKIKPKYFYIASDGHRENKEGEKEIVEKTRKTVMDNIDWDCEVKTLFREKNFGCKYAVSSAISWFFENVKQGIILEDDCLPSQSFFPFCQELLERYKNDERVNVIGGRNRFSQKNYSGADYFFSKYNRIWGWASWQRAWEGYDPDMKNWPEIKKEKIKSFFDSYLERKHFEDIWDKCFAGEIDTWDYQWFLHRLQRGGCTAVPKKNLIKNIGLGHQAGTHTSGADSDVCSLNELEFPLKHPAEVRADNAQDKKMRKFRGGSIFSKIIKIIAGKL